MEGRCFVLNACQMSPPCPDISAMIVDGRRMLTCSYLVGCDYFSQQKDFPNDHPVEQDGVRDPEAIMIRGGSCIVSPMGEVLAGPLRGEEGWVLPFFSRTSFFICWTIRVIGLMYHFFLFASLGYSPLNWTST